MTKLNPMNKTTLFLGYMTLNFAMDSLKWHEASAGTFVFSILTAALSVFFVSMLEKYVEPRVFKLIDKVFRESK